MSFPKKSERYMADGKPGTRASDNPVYYQVGQTVAGTDGVTAGRFVWGTAGTNDSEIYNPTTFENKGSDKPTGFVEAQTLQTYIGAINSDASMIIHAGESVLVAARGDYFATVTATATVGHKVFASTTTGEIQTATAGATLAGYVETDWHVSRGSKSAGTIIISNN